MTSVLTPPRAHRALSLATAVVLQGWMLQGASTVRFNAPFSYPVSATRFAAADFDGDGNLDLLCGQAWGGGVPSTVLQGLGDGTFRFLADLPYASAFVTGDFTSDGISDIILRNGRDLSVVPSNGDGRFLPPVHTTLPTDCAEMVAADFDHDGHVDLALAGSDGAVILLGVGDGTFQPPVLYPSATGDLITAGDFNGDGSLDLAIASWTGHSNRKTGILLGSPTGVFTLAPGLTPSLLWDSLGAIAASDLNRDGFCDLLYLRYGWPCSVSVDSGSAGGFRDWRCLDGTDYLVSIGEVQFVADFNHDGALDRVTGDRSSEFIEVFLNAGDGIFRTPTQVGSHQRVEVAIADDFDGDGNTDILSTAFLGHVFLSRGNGSGNFITSRVSSVVTNCLYLAAGDFRGSGLSDLLVGDGTGRAWVLQNSGFGSFFPLTNYAAHGVMACTGDFNGDKRVDFAVADMTDAASNDPSITIYQGHGDGTFELAAVIRGLSWAAYKPYNQEYINLNRLHAADFNGDGLTDLAATDFVNGGIAVFLAHGGDLFERMPNTGGGLSPRGICAGDFNHDGAVDLANVNCNAGRSLFVVLGNGDGTFRAPREYLSPKVPVDVITSDVNQDGEADLIVLGAYSQNVAVMLGDGTGSFTNVMHWGLTRYDAHEPLALTAGDFNRDTRPDIVVGGRYGLSVLEPIGLKAPTLSLDSFTPLHGGVAARVHITGSSLERVSQVRFSGAAADFILESDGSISARVPAGASSGPIFLRSPDTVVTITNAFIVDALPANDAFGDRIVVHGVNLLTSSSTVNATYEPNEPAYWDSSATRSVWWSWTAPTAGFCRISVRMLSGDMAHIAVYVGSQLSQLEQIARGIREPATFVAERGVTYEIAVIGGHGWYNDWGTGGVEMSLALDSFTTYLEPAPTQGVQRFRLDLYGMTGLYSIQASTNLLDWVPFQDVDNSDVPTPLRDPSAAINPSRFFRAVKK